MRYCILFAGLLLIAAPAVALDLGSAERVPSLSVYNPPPAPTLQLSVAESEFQLAYDSDPMWYFPDWDSVGTEWAVRFTPPQACSLSYFELSTYDESWNSGPVALTLYIGDSVSGPDSPISSTVTFTAAGDASRQRITLDPPVDIGDNEFFIAIKVVNTASPHITGDDDGGTGRSWYKGPSQPWDWIEDVDLNIRAYVILYGEDVVGPVVLHHADPSAFTSDGQTVISAYVEDASGLQSVRLKFSTNMGSSYMSVPMGYSSGFYRATIPAQLPNSVVKYYIEAIDDSPLHNQALDPAGGEAAPYEFTTYSGGQIKYDNGWPAYYFIESDIYDGNAFAVLFTPTSFPITVTKVRVYVSETTPFKISVCRATTAEPGMPFAGPFTANADVAPGWVEVAIPESVQPLISAGHFFVKFEWMSMTPESPGVGADTLDIDGRSLYYDNAQGWNTWSLSDWMIRAVYSTPVGVMEAEGGAVPEKFDLAQNYPNPFNPSTTIEYAMPESGPVTFAVFNALGQKVRFCDVGWNSAGNHQLSWDGRDDRGAPVPSGVYYYRLTAGNLTETRKMVLLK